MNKNKGELIKFDLPEINQEMQRIVNQHNDKQCVDLRFVMGLLYIATSNCAMRWKYGEEAEDATTS